MKLSYYAVLVIKMARPYIKQILEAAAARTDSKIDDNIVKVVVELLYSVN